MAGLLHRSGLVADVSFSIIGWSCIQFVTEKFTQAAVFLKSDSSGDFANSEASGDEEFPRPVQFELQEVLLGGMADLRLESTFNGSSGGADRGEDAFDAGISEGMGLQCLNRALGQGIADLGAGGIP